MKNKHRRTLIKLVSLGILFPKLSFAMDKTFGESFYHKYEKKSVLIAYASEYGSTSEVAEMIGKTISKSGVRVDIKYIKHITNIKEYDQIIIGSPIQYDSWMDDAKNFLNTYEQELLKVRVSYFFTCLTLSQKSDKSKKQAQNYANNLEQLNPRIKPENIGQFAGVLDYSKFSFSFSIVARAMFSILGVKEGDYRNWDVIRQWSNKLK